VQYIHRGVDGRAYAGPATETKFDSVVKCSPWLAKLGSNIYDVLLAANPYINWVRRKFDLPHWSLSSYLKNKAKTAVQYIGSFEDAVATAARKRGVDTVVCGISIAPRCATSTGFCIAMTGDWVESCTSLVEDMNGHLRLIDWPKMRDQARVALSRYPSVKRHGRLGVHDSTTEVSGAVRLSHALNLICSRHRMRIGPLAPSHCKEKPISAQAYLYQMYAGRRFRADTTPLRAPMPLDARLRRNALTLC